MNKHVYVYWKVTSTQAFNLILLKIKALILYCPISYGIIYTVLNTYSASALLME